MSNIPAAIQAARVYVDGAVTPEMAEVELPEVSHVVTELQSMGVAGSVEVVIPGLMEVMNATFKSRSISAGGLAKLIRPGVASEVDVRFAVAQYDATLGRTVNVGGRAVMRCQGKSMKNPAVKPGQEDGSEVEVSVSYYHLIIGGTTIVEVDPVNFVLIYDSVDLLEALRSIL